MRRFGSQEWVSERKDPNKKRLGSMPQPWGIQNSSPNEH
jgi:hypothetical protein